MRHPEMQNELLLSEMNFSFLRLQTSPKCYWIWNHRKWTLSYTKDYAAELELTNQLLSLDSRNFHGWAYRKYIVEKMGVAIGDELEFTQQMISKNLSNFSAWHVRSCLLPKYLQAIDSAQKEIVLQKGDLKETDLIKAALYTDPDDQSIWFYYRWLRSVFGVQEDESMLQELYSLEPNCKWVLISIVETKGRDRSPFLDKLIQIDPLRKGRYEEMKEMPN